MNVPADVRLPRDPVFAEFDILDICQGCGQTMLTCDERDDPCEGCTCSGQHVLYVPPPTHIVALVKTSCGFLALRLIRWGPPISGV